MVLKWYCMNAVVCFSSTHARILSGRVRRGEAGGFVSFLHQTEADINGEKLPGESLSEVTAVAWPKPGSSFSAKSEQLDRDVPPVEFNAHPAPVILSSRK